MILIKGQGVSAGVVKGPVCFLKRRESAYLRRDGLNPEEETQRFLRAQQEAIGQLNALAEECRAQAGEEAAALFETHALMAADEDYAERVREIIASEKCSAEYAAEQAGEQFAEELACMEDAYMCERAADIRDVARRISDVLTGARQKELPGGRPVILAADDLAPSETVRLNRKSILAFVTRAGSAVSHTAILARTMGIPAVCGLGSALKEEYEGMTACVDGESGQVMLEPDEKAISEFEKKHALQKEREQLLSELRGKADMTPEGQRLDVFCNIGSVGDVAAVIENDGQGIGLFRSEFLYLAADDYPDEETQFRAYREAAAAMQGKRVVIRTLDAGADKQAVYFHTEKEENPALGLRGVRFCLSRPEIFRTQLRALYRASAYGKVAIMFPMITSVREVRACRELARGVMEQLEREGVSFSRETEIGVMIETPASVLIADDLAREVDFFSVGTNDLTQYLLACDRQAGDMNGVYDPRHPAILRAIRMAADAARRAGIWIGVCGELGADPEMLPFFLEAGVDEISVSPAAVLPLRMEIRRGPTRQK